MGTTRWEPGIKGGGRGAAGERGNSEGKKREFYKAPRIARKRRVWTPGYGKLGILIRLPSPQIMCLTLLACICTSSVASKRCLPCLQQVRLTQTTEDSEKKLLDLWNVNYRARDLEKYLKLGYKLLSYCLFNFLYKAITTQTRTTHLTGSFRRTLGCYFPRLLHKNMTKGAYQMSWTG